jgi:hypothetical protein
VAGSLLDLVDTLVLCGGLAAIMWVGMHASRRKRRSRWPPAAAMGMLVWLAALGVAFYLIFG